MPKHKLYFGIEYSVEKYLHFNFSHFVTSYQKHPIKIKCNSFTHFNNFHFALVFRLKTFFLF